MAYRLGIYRESGLDAPTRAVLAAFPGLFPGLEAEPAQIRDLPHAAWDTAKGHFDVHYLLDSDLPLPQRCDAALWLVGEDIGDPWLAWVFGAAAPDRAVVSGRRLESEQDVAKVACHEVGHLLGLGHCKARCVMQVSRTTGHVRRKPLSFCDRCAELIRTALSSAKRDLKRACERPTATSGR